MSMLSEARIWARFLRGLRQYLRTTITLQDAQDIVAERLEQRAANFLAWVERGIYGYARSPYRPMLELAGCEFGDLQAMVADRGLEGTLTELRAAGVHVSFEEYKGRQPIVRGGKELPIDIGDFDNPFIGRFFEGETGGTTGQATRVLIDLDHLATQASDLMLGFHANDLLNRPTAVWLDILPDVAGIMNVLRQMRFGLHDPPLD
jgi:hypothetical protein